MRILVVYDSVHGNTEKIAREIGSAMGDDAKVVRVGEAGQAMSETPDFLVVGSPTHGGRATPELQALLDRTPLQGVKVALFDTRLDGRMIRMFGYAAPRMAEALRAKGANVVGTPEGFIVVKTKGPLKDGELERAQVWAKGLM